MTYDAWAGIPGFPGRAGFPGRGRSDFLVGRGRDKHLVEHLVDKISEYTE
jgi:hypothetical protein